MSIDEKVRRQLLGDMDLLRDNGKLEDQEPEAIFDYLVRIAGTEYAEILRAEMPHWGTIIVTECGIDKKLESAYVTKDWDQFGQYVTEALAYYALKVETDGLFIIKEYMAENETGMSQLEEDCAAYNRMRVDNMKGAL